MSSDQSGTTSGAISSTLWSAGQAWGTRLFGFVVFFILARLLDPTDFGLVALAGVYVAFLTIFVDQGFSEALIQRSTLDDLDLNTAFWIGMLISCSMMVFSWLAAGLIADLFREPQLVPIIAWLSLTFPLIGLSSVQQALLRRNMAFQSLAIRSMIASLAGGIVGLVMALLNFGVWSLVGQQIVTQGIGVLVLWQVSDWRPKLEFSRDKGVELFSFGINILGSKLLNFASRRSDDMLIGYFLGAEMLGYYTIAYRTLTIMTQSLIQPITSVAFSVFSKQQHDRELLTRTFLQWTKLTSIIAFPAFLGVAAVAPEFIPLAYGSGWTPSIPLTQILMLAGFLQSVLYFHGVLMIALGKPSWRVVILTVSTILTLLGFAAAIRVGLTAVAAAYVIAGYLTMPLELFYTKGLVDIRIGRYFMQFLPMFAASCFMVASISLVRPFLPAELHLFWQFTTLVAVGGVTYFALLVVFAPRLVRELATRSRMLFMTSKHVAHAAE